MNHVHQNYNLCERYIDSTSCNGYERQGKRMGCSCKFKTKSEDGYLQSELPKCKVKNYLIGNVKVQAYVDSTNCCDGLRDYES